MILASKAWFLLRYGLIGLSGGLLLTGVLYVWVSILSLKEWYLLGSVLGFLVALAVTFALQKYWTFRDFTKEHMKRQFFSYTAVAVVSLGLNLLLLHLSKLIVESFDFDFFHTWYLVAQIAIIVLLAGCSFLANYFLTFRPTV